MIGNEKKMEKDMGTQMELMDKLLLIEPGNWLG